MPKEYKCEICNKNYASYQTMYQHNKNLHPDLNIKIGKVKKNKLQCEYCKKILSRTDNLARHKKSCGPKIEYDTKSEILTEFVAFKREINKKLNITENIREENESLKKENEILKNGIYPITNQLLNVINNKTNIIQKLEDDVLKNTDNQKEIIKEDIVEQGQQVFNDENNFVTAPTFEINDILKKEINDKDIKIKMLENICIEKQKRLLYSNKNVVYIIANEDNKKNRIYCVGKTKNLTNRLSTYNRNGPHEVIYYRECNNEDHMNIVEHMILNKLKDYKEKANNDRFLLPIDKNIKLFIDIIDKCIEF